VNISGGDIAIQREQASLLAKVLSPEDAVIEMKGAPVRLGVPITRPGYLQVNSAGKSMGANFLVVLYPKKTNPQDRHPGSAAMKNLSNTITSLKGKNYVGTRIARSNAEDEILFRIDDDKETIQDGHLVTDGRMVVRTVRGNQLELLAVHDATYLTYNAVRWLAPLTGVTGTTKFTAAGAFHGNTAEWDIQADHAGTLTFHSLQKPLEVKHNGQTIPSILYDEGNRLLTIEVAKGTNKFTMQY
jgi:hypothetical protein